MENDELKCPICGEPTFVYFGHPRKDRLCAMHGKMANAGEIEQCPDCGAWHNADEDCECKNKQNIKDEIHSMNQGHTNCIICEAPSNGKLQCKKCYTETTEYMNGLNKNSLTSEFRDYYYNLKDALYRMKDFDIVKSNCNKLFAIAYQNAESNGDSLLISLIEKDVTKIIENKKPKEKITQTPNIIEKSMPSGKANELTCIICGQPSNGKHFCYKCLKQYQNKVVYLQIKNCKDFIKLDAEYESELICDDGHMVKSPYEKIIDNWLYAEGIKHAYERKIDINETQDITPDFFIPEYKGTQNIYIEFWGYGKENIKYTQIKEYKEKLYPELIKRDNIAVVYLTKKEVDDDSYKKKIKYAKQGELKK